MPSAQSRTREYGIITAAYWVFTLTDGALRMLVLLFLHGLGYSPLQIASLFLFYEFFGVVTNLAGGWLGGRFGLRLTLLAGLLLQSGACSLLAWQAENLTLWIALLAQAVSGVAKDLTKMSAKSYIKLVVPEEQAGRLLSLVAVLTGSKNALKGVGFFLGGFLLQALGFAGSCTGMAVFLLLAAVVSLVALPRAAGRSSNRVTLRGLFAHEAPVNWLSGARFFLFGARDVWFVLALPIFLVSVAGWSNSGVGAFLAVWVVGYGMVQAFAPALLRGSRQVAPWTAALLLPLGAIFLGLQQGLAPVPVLIVGLLVFGVVFAINSALHSYLIVSLAGADTVAAKVGFYYMANAAGRLLGTVLSGSLFQWGGGGQRGLLWCIAGAMVLVSLSTALAVGLCRHVAGAAAIETRLDDDA